MNLPNSLLVGIIMGSKSDWPTMQKAAEVLEQFQVPLESRVVSAHRTPNWMFEYAQTAEDHGLKLIIAGAGGTAQPILMSYLIYLFLIAPPSVSFLASSNQSS